MGSLLSFLKKKGPARAMSKASSGSSSSIATPRSTSTTTTTSSGPSAAASGSLYGGAQPAFISKQQSFPTSTTKSDYSASHDQQRQHPHQHPKHKYAFIPDNYKSIDEVLFHPFNFSLPLTLITISVGSFHQEFSFTTNMFSVMRFFLVAQGF